MIVPDLQSLHEDVRKADLDVSLSEPTKRKHTRPLKREFYRGESDLTGCSLKCYLIL